MVFDIRLAFRKLSVSTGIVVWCKYLHDGRPHGDLVVFLWFWDEPANTSSTRATDYEHGLLSIRGNTSKTYT